jgi:hypothetical protein
MYKTAIEYYQEPVRNHINYSQYNGPVKHVKEKFVQVQEQVQGQAQEQGQAKQTKQSHMKWQTNHYSNMSDPRVWGPAFWFTLHNGSSKYPIDASPFTKERMMGYIKGMPFMLPCTACKGHAITHINENKDNLDDICSGREKLFKFLVDFHNTVNKRHGKRIVSVEEAYKIYDGGIGVSTLTYS